VQYSTRVWIDHNTLSHGYDGAIDIKRASDYVTVSWNHVFNHDKDMLLGHSDDNGSEDIGHLRVTYHHNWFDGTVQRNPRVRFGNPVHVFNNYYCNTVGLRRRLHRGRRGARRGQLLRERSRPVPPRRGRLRPGHLVARNNTLS
jgi:pectate lyase